MANPPPAEPMSKLQILKTFFFGIFVMALWLIINGFLWWTLNFARNNIKHVDDLP
jgi:hypothetical protein